MKIELCNIYTYSSNVCNSIICCKLYSYFDASHINNYQVILIYITLCRLTENDLSDPTASKALGDSIQEMTALRELG